MYRNKFLQKQRVEFRLKIDQIWQNCLSRKPQVKTFFLDSIGVITVNKSANEHRVSVVKAFHHNGNATYIYWIDDVTIHYVRTPLELLLFQS